MEPCHHLRSTKVGPCTWHNSPPFGVAGRSAGLPQAERSPCHSICPHFVPLEQGMTSIHCAQTHPSPHWDPHWVTATAPALLTQSHLGAFLPPSLLTLLPLFLSPFFSFFFIFNSFSIFFFFSLPFFFLFFFSPSPIPENSCRAVTSPCCSRVRTDRIQSELLNAAPIPGRGGDVIGRWAPPGGGEAQCRPPRPR